MGLKKYCIAPESYFKSLGTVHTVPNGYYVHKDNGSNVLGVAHLDTVLESSHYSFKHNMVHSPNLDDRLGVYALLKVLPSLGVNLDILLTTNEEIGRSTASHFTPSKDYNWIAEFDRAGTDVVMYQYESEESEQTLKRYGFRLGIGSYSDICDLEHLGITAFNFGIGYHRQHTENCYANMRDVFGQCRKFARMYHDLKDTPMEFEYIPDVYGVYSHWDMGAYNTWETFDRARCGFCDTVYYDDRNIESIDTDGICCECSTLYKRWLLPSQK